MKHLLLIAVLYACSVHAQEPSYPVHDSVTYAQTKTMSAAVLLNWFDYYYSEAMYYVKQGDTCLAECDRMHSLDKMAAAVRMLNLAKEYNNRARSALRTSEAFLTQLVGRVAKYIIL